MGSKSASTLGSHSLSEDTAGDGGGGEGLRQSPQPWHWQAPAPPHAPTCSLCLSFSLLKSGISLT